MNYDRGELLAKVKDLTQSENSEVRKHAKQLQKNIRDEVVFNMEIAMWVGKLEKLENGND